MYAEWVLADRLCLLSALSCLQPVIPVRQPGLLTGSFTLSQTHIKHTIHILLGFIKVWAGRWGVEGPEMSFDQILHFSHFDKEHENVMGYLQDGQIV